MTTLTALDGWRAEYDRDTLPHRFDVFNVDGVRQYCVSGEIDDASLRRLLAGFRGTHREVQMRLL